MNTPQNRPQMPKLVGLPLRLVPARLHSVVAAVLLERVFTEQRNDGERDFMEGRIARVRVLDVGIDISIRAGANGFQSCPGDLTADLTIDGMAYDYLQLITGREDPDSLFFRRRLRMSGDTALGVHLKNFLASVDPDFLPLAVLIRPGLERGLNLYERVLG